MTRQELQEKVYTPIQDLKNRFYNCQNQNDWNQLKEELKDLLNVAKESMNAEFYKEYSKGVINTITKIYGYKQKQFNKAEKKQFTPKSSYIFREGAESDAFINLCNAMAEYYKSKTK